VGVQRKHVNELCNDRRNVTAATALILARVFGNSPDFWLNVQRRSDLWKAMHSPRERARIDRANAIEPDRSTAGIVQGSLVTPDSIRSGISTENCGPSTSTRLVPSTPSSNSNECLRETGPPNVHTIIAIDVDCEWDEHKRQLNLRKHEVDFADAVEVFYNDLACGMEDSDITTSSASPSPASTPSGAGRHAFN
jgi:hypothetical protein